MCFKLQKKMHKNHHLALFLISQVAHTYMEAFVNMRTFYFTSFNTMFYYSKLYVFTNKETQGKNKKKYKLT